MIELRNVTKRYGLTTLAVRDLSFQIQDNEFLVIYGPAGAGKTTTLRLIGGITKPTKGDIVLDGQSLLNVAPENRNMAMAFENYALYPHISVYENLAFPLRAKRFPQKEIDERVRRVARVLQISELLDRRPGFLSGGQRQRVSLGRAIIRPARVYLLDEPIGHLDAKLRHRMRGELKAMSAELNATIVLVTTSSREALALGDRIAILRAGVLEQVGTPEEIYHRPSNEFVAAFVGEPPMSFLPIAPVHDNGQMCFRIAGSDRVLPASARLSFCFDGDMHGYRLGIRASDVLIASQADDRHTVPGEVYVVEPLGYCNVVSIRIGEGLLRAIVSPLVRPKPKETVWLCLDCDRVHLFHNGRAVAHALRSQQMTNLHVERR